MQQEILSNATNIAHKMNTKTAVLCVFFCLFVQLNLWTTISIVLDIFFCSFSFDCIVSLVFICSIQWHTMFCWNKLHPHVYKRTPNLLPQQRTFVWIGCFFFQFLAVVVLFIRNILWTVFVIQIITQKIYIAFLKLKNTSNFWVFSNLINLSIEAGFLEEKKNNRFVRMFLTINHILWITQFPLIWLKCTFSEIFSFHTTNEGSRVEVTKKKLSVNLSRLHTKQRLVSMSNLFRNFYS